MLFSVFILKRIHVLYLQRYPHHTAKFDVTIELQEENKEANKQTNTGVKTHTKIKRNRSKLLHRRKVKFGQVNT